MRFSIILIALFLCNLYSAQKASSPKERQESFEKRKSLIEGSLIKNLKFENIGPSVMSGRVTDIEVNPENSAHFFVAYASGGLWETKNNGTTFDPIFDHEIVMTIGDIAVDWRNQIIYVGSGENNSSRSSYAGFGIFKGIGFGKQWENIGLTDSHHIGKIVIHPSQPNKIYVAALGHLYSENKERGIFLSEDGGNSWQNVLFLNENCGGIDLVINTNKPDILYASMWERSRRAWNFVESGESSGIYRSENGGKDWKKVSAASSGFPSGIGVGRIGLDLYNDNDKECIYAFLDNQHRRAKEEKKQEGLTKDDFKNINKESFLILEEAKLEQFLRDNGFPRKYDARSVKEMVKEEEINPIALVEYLENANSLLFDTPVIGAELYKSCDGGKSWIKTHDDFLDDIVYSYGYYFGLIRVDPNNVDRVYIAGVPILKSEDGGKNFSSINGDNVHPDHHALWINPNLEGHLINGNDGGVNISYDFGEQWIKCNSPAVGQFYTVQVDNEEPYNVYGGFQDNGVWYGPNDYEWSSSWHESGRYPYRRIMGGDGMQVMIDDRDPNIVYTGYQFGNYYRINKSIMESQYITPKHELGERPYRWNWQSPIWLSKHNQDILYMGSNKFHRSMDKGESWEEISADLTMGGKKGDVPFGTITTIHESPRKFGLLYAGTDDGRLHLSKDGGNNWSDISGKLPQNMWVSRVKASQHYLARVYVSLNGYRQDNFDAMIYVSDDYGKTWNDLSSKIANEAVNVIYEDPKNESLLYVGSDNGLYASLDAGKSFMHMSDQLPAAPVHDLVVHPTEGDLIVATHGRSLYKADVSFLQILGDSILNSDLYVQDIEDINYYKNWGESWSKWLEAESPEMSVNIWSSESRTAIFSVLFDELTLFSKECRLEKGLNQISYDLTIHNNWDEFKRKFTEANAISLLKESSNGMKYLIPAEYKVQLVSEDLRIVKGFEVSE